MKITVKVTGSAFPTPVIFDVLDNVWWLKLLPGVGGITLSANTVRIRYPWATALNMNPYLIVHEAAHVLQAQALGWKYLPVYIWQAIKAGFKKDDIPMEQEAYIKQINGITTVL